MSEKETSPSETAVAPTAAAAVAGTGGDDDNNTAVATSTSTNLSFSSITDGENERGIPIVKFIEDITAFSESFGGETASPELMIGAFTDLFTKYKAYETKLSQQRLSFQQKIPEIEKSLQLVQFLKQKQSETLFKEEESDEDVDSTDKLDDDDENKELITRYELADTIYAKAELCIDQGIVHLWLGANVMLEYTYDGAIELLVDKLKIAKKQLQETTRDLAFTRNQIITSEVNISRIYNWDIRNKRQK